MDETIIMDGGRTSSIGSVTSEGSHYDFQREYCGCEAEVCESRSMLEVLGTVWRRMTDKVIKDAHDCKDGNLPALKWMEETAGLIWDVSPEAGPWMRFFLHVQVGVIQGLAELASGEGELQVSREIKAGIVRTVCRVLGIIAPKCNLGTHAVRSYEIHRDVTVNPEAVKTTNLLYGPAYTTLMPAIRDALEDIAQGGCDGVWLECLTDVVGRGSIQDAKTIKMFFDRWDDDVSMSPDVKVKVLTVLEGYFNDKNVNAERNRSVASGAEAGGAGGLLSVMLGLYQNLPPAGLQVANSIIRNLGRHWINVPLVKKLFVMMKSNRGGVLEWLLDGVCGMAVRQYKPKRSFLHSGSLCGFHFSLPNNLLPLRGFSMSLGLYIDPYRGKDKDDTHGDMCLAWVGDGKGNELCVTLTHSSNPNLFKVKVRTVNHKGKSVMTFEDLSLKIQTWYDLSLSMKTSHQYYNMKLGSGPWSRSEAILCAKKMGEESNKTEMARSVLNYPQWAKKTDGTALLLGPPNTSVDQDGERMTYFKGSTTAV